MALHAASFSQGAHTHGGDPATAAPFDAGPSDQPAWSQSTRAPQRRACASSELPADPSDSWEQTEECGMMRNRETSDVPPRGGAHVRERTAGDLTWASGRAGVGHTDCGKQITPTVHLNICL